MNNVCTCKGRFMDAEDFRDHMPCPGSPSEKAFSKAKAEGIREGMERAAKVVLEYSPSRALDWETSLYIREGLSVLAEAIRAAAKAGKERG